MDPRLIFALLAVPLAAACTRTEAPPPAPRPSQAPASAPAENAAAPAVGEPTASAATAVGGAPAAPAAPPPVAIATLTSQVWQVTASRGVAAGSLYVFLADGTLLVGTPGSTLAQGRWRSEGGRLVMVEESQSHPAEVLALQPDRLKLRSHNPGSPVEMTLQPVAAAAPPVPPRFHGTWAADARACKQPGAESRLALAGDTVRFHESSGTVLAAVPDASDAHRLDLIARLSGEGSTRLAWRRYRLARDGASLTDVTDASQPGLARVRCR